jgi:hypothetical protein
MRTEGARLSPPQRGERSFEYGIGIGAFLSNNDLFMPTLLMSLFKSDRSIERLAHAPLLLDSGAYARPLLLKLKRGIWTFDIFSGLDTRAAIALSGTAVVSLQNLLFLATHPDVYSAADTLAQLNAAGGKVSVGLSAFFEIGAGFSRHFLNNTLSVRAAPSLYFPLLYMRNAGADLRADYETPDGGSNTAVTITGLRSVSDIELLSSFNIYENDYAAALSAVGLDLSLEGRYALWPILEIGAIITHLPLFPASTNYKTSMNISAAIDARSMPGFDYRLNYSVPGKTVVLRPIDILFFTVYKPLGNTRVTLTPHIGWTFNTLLANGSAGGTNGLATGLEAALNLRRFFSVALGSRLRESAWTNRLAFQFDMRFLEIDCALTSQAADFPASWTGTGLGAELVIKLGY